MSTSRLATPRMCTQNPSGHLSLRSHPYLIVHFLTTSLLISRRGILMVIPQQLWPRHMSLGLPLPLPTSYTALVRQSQRSLNRGMVHGVLLGRFAVFLRFTMEVPWPDHLWASVSWLSLSSGLGPLVIDYLLSCLGTIFPFLEIPLMTGVI